MSHHRSYHIILFLTLHVADLMAVPVSVIDIGFRECEPIRIDMCRNLGYNETSMPNLAGNEVQSEAEYTLQSFSPLIEYVCSSQLKLFLCATYVPMCTPKAPVPIGPCQNLCESVRSRCDPVLQGFGYNWPPALDCSLFPKENNQETMCMEGPGESQEIKPVVETFGHSVDKIPSLQSIITTSSTFECPGLYEELHRPWRCVPLCEANVLFSPNEKHIAEIWTKTWTYTALGMALFAIICVLKSDSKELKQCEVRNIRELSPLVWCHSMVVVGWTVRFIAGRSETSCGYDPQKPNVSLLLVDGLSNGPCAATFILRYYFEMAASAWWAILCLGWHRDVRRNSPDTYGQILIGGCPYSTVNKSGLPIKQPRGGMIKSYISITSSNLARFLAWGLPAFQTAAVIVARLVDADELLGSCFVGNQSDKGLQILVATPLFCYWIFGSMNLASGFLVYRRNREILDNTNLPSMRLMMQASRSISGSFLFIYCLPCALLLMAIIYEFANIDVWLNVALSSINRFETPMWPFMTRTFMEFMLAIICSARILGPRISLIYKRQTTQSTIKTNIQLQPFAAAASSFGSSDQRSQKQTSFASYTPIRHPKNVPVTHVKHHHHNSAIVLKNIPNNSMGFNKKTKNYPTTNYKNGIKNVHHSGDETIL